MLSVLSWTTSHIFPVLSSCFPRPLLLHSFGEECSEYAAEREGAHFERPLPTLEPFYFSSPLQLLVFSLCCWGAFAVFVLNRW